MRRYSLACLALLLLLSACGAPGGDAWTANAREPPDASTENVEAPTAPPDTRQVDIGHEVAPVPFQYHAPCPVEPCAMVQ